MVNGWLSDDSLSLVVLSFFFFLSIVTNALEVVLQFCSNTFVTMSLTCHPCLLQMFLMSIYFAAVPSDADSPIPRTTMVTRILVNEYGDKIICNFDMK